MSIQTADVHFFNNIINMYRYSYSLSALHIVSCCCCFDLRLEHILPAAVLLQLPDGRTLTN